MYVIILDINISDWEHNKKTNGVYISHNASYCYFYSSDNHEFFPAVLYLRETVEAI